MINNSGEDTENHEKQTTQVLPIWDCVDVDKRLIFHVAVGNGATVTVRKIRTCFYSLIFISTLILMFGDNMGS